MDELPLGLSPAGRGHSDMGVWLKSWQVGQLLRAQVMDNAGAGTVKLQIANHQVTAATDIFLPRGAWLSLEVTSLMPAPRVRILDATTPVTQQHNLVKRQAQTLLPRQGNVLSPLLPFAESVQRVNLLSLLGIRGALVDPAFDELVLPGPPRSPEALRRAMLRSGLYFEATLAQQAPGGPPVAPTDLKALLFRLLAKVTRARGEQQSAAGDRAALTALSSVGKEVEGALATISLNQLSATLQRDQEAWIWVFHVPFRLREELHGLSLTLRREAPGQEEPEPEREWKALLVLSLPRLGELEVEVFLRGSRVSVVFYSGREETVQLLQVGLAALGARLHSHGYDIGVLRAHQGEREAADDDRSWRSSLYQSV